MLIIDEYSEYSVYRFAIRHVTHVTVLNLWVLGAGQVKASKLHVQICLQRRVVEVLQTRKDFWTRSC